MLCGFGWRWCGSVIAVILEVVFRQLWVYLWLLFSGKKEFGVVLLVNHKENRDGVWGLFE